MNSKAFLCVLVRVHQVSSETLVNVAIGVYLESIRFSFFFFFCFELNYVLGWKLLELIMFCDWIAKVVQITINMERREWWYASDVFPGGSVEKI